MEIERKFLINPAFVPYDLDNLKSYSIEQAYISFNPVIRIRNINNGEQFLLTVKNGEGLAREELETMLSKEQYDMLFEKYEGYVINKTRYVHELENGLKEEIDIFKEELEGLAYLEIEFPSVKEAKAYKVPKWVLKEVTENEKYKNNSLALYGKPID